MAAVTKDDNINLMVAQIARELFGVKHVIARVAEPSRKEVYTERFGLRIVCGTNLTAQGLLAGILQEEDDEDQCVICLLYTSVEPSAFVRTAAPGGHDGIRRAARQRHDGTCQHPAYAACG